MSLWLRFGRNVEFEGQCLTTMIHFVAYKLAKLSHVALCTLYAFHRFNPDRSVSLWTDNMTVVVPAFVRKKMLDSTVFEDTPLHRLQELLSSRKRCRPCYSNQNVANAARLAILSTNMAASTWISTLSRSLRFHAMRLQSQWRLF